MPRLVRFLSAVSRRCRFCSSESPLSQGRDVFFSRVPPFVHLSNPDLPSLIMLELKNGSFENGELRWNGTPFPLFSLLSDLPKLTSFKCGDNCFRRRHTLSLKRARFSFFVELQRSNRSSISPADSRAFRSAISIWWRVFCYFPLNELQICRSWSRFGSAVPRFGVQLDSISPI